ncbi:MAG TPA: lipocalin-like domain-containing protein [Bryobacteraceae bacterium]|jgi:predicted secreted hydrolase|nr:lipocalin-like domain-containing protein [Bryobacteraceae bacterium]
MRSSALICVLFIVLASAQSWEIAQPGYRYEFPRDHFSHPGYETEWWYYTGNLHAPHGHRYGFELTFFRQAQKLNAALIASEPPVWRPDQIYLAHLALSDIDGHRFYHQERLHRAGPGLAGAALSDQRYWNGNWQVRWTALPRADQELMAVCERFTIELHLKSAKPPVIQGQDGISRKGPQPAEASHYISFTRLTASGTLKLGTTSEPVNGTAWMDHEFFSEPPASDLTGWDWFAIQLNTNEELMLYRLRDAHGRISPYSSGSYVDPQGRARFLAGSDFALVPQETWHSAQSGATYPVTWQIRVPSLGLLLNETTDLKDQELREPDSASPTYWEGAVNYRGTSQGKPITGVGYLEMTGYAQPVKLSGLSPQK